MCFVWPGAAMQWDKSSASPVSVLAARAALSPPQQGPADAGKGAVRGPASHAPRT